MKYYAKHFYEYYYYFSVTGLPAQERDMIHASLLLTSDFVEATTFQKARNHAVSLLQMEWLHYLKEDLAVFLE